MSRNILKKRPPASPNQPPPASMNIPHKGQPIPIDINLLVMGSTMPRTSRNEESCRSFGIAQVTKLTTRPYSAQVDRHVLRSMGRNPSVESSYYDRFERLDRDWVEGDTAYKEKGGRVKSAGKQRPVHPAARDRKRPNSATGIRENKDSFFDVAMSFDDETTINTKTNAEIQSNIQNSVSKKEIISSASEHKRRPRSGKKSRDISGSSKKHERSDSKGSRSVGSASYCSSRPSVSDKRHRKPRARKSRSRTRRSRRRSDFGQSSKKNSPERNPSNVRSVRSASKKRAPILDEDLIHRLGMKVSQDSSKKQPVKKIQNETDGIRKQSVSKIRTATQHNHSGVSKPGAIGAVMKANQVQERLKEMETIDKLMYKEDRRYTGTTSNFPRLKMVVAPTATPLATLVRSSSAKMLMNNAATMKKHAHES